MLTAEAADLSIPVIETVFSKRSDMRDNWSEHLQAGPDKMPLAGTPSVNPYDCIRNPITHMRDAMQCARC